eukprot:CAMPEP_0183731492 /NCGR_PEP_ID=MMETSP0737-20130205/35582_1 /TAXON_ID=385413 /ORGANISM="Thalassiosira miniscula, Strain CCMP1093" /LENGTH=592 /DNA_ID=CAMNT_0025964233 /DNA_START=137 /DNA_END=1912 /DNA_ORIENTATION=+
MISSESLWLTLMTCPPFGIIAATLVIGYVIFEIGFFFHYQWHLVPRANQVLYHAPAPFRDYMEIKDREKLLLRIIHRISARIPNKCSNAKNGSGHLHDNSAVDSSEACYNFIESWFQKKSDDTKYDRFSEEFDMATLDVGLCPPPPSMIRMAWSSVGGNTDDSLKSSDSSSVLDEGEQSSHNEECNKKQNGQARRENAMPKMGKLQKGNMDEFLSWALFGVPFSTAQSNPDMQQALDKFYTILQTDGGLTFEPGHNPNYKPRSFTFEKVKALYRPFFIYASVALMRLAGDCFLYAIGFRQYSCKRGLRYWHRPAEQQCGSPFLFFHGIAPGGHAPYIPMILFGVLKGQLSHKHRDVFLFENKPISYALCFDALSEKDTIQGVLEALQRHIPTSTSLTVCGHSFGSCQLTWMVKSPEIKSRIRQLILLDPVSILLSEPDVVVNFLYNRHEVECQQSGHSNGWIERLIRFCNETKIHLVASSEMFIEYYLRRNFAWYNSEIWLQDIPHDVKVTVFLAERDEIVNTQKIERELELHNSRVSREACNSVTSMGPLIKKVIWKDVGHAHCVMNPERWSDINQVMRKLESQIMNEKSC